jgi:hypothetical protein
MRNLTLTIHFCDISQSFVSATKYENTSSGRVRVWRRSNEQYLQRCMQTRVPFRSGSVMQASTLEGALISMFVEGMSKDYDSRRYTNDIIDIILPQFQVAIGENFAYLCKLVN